MFVQKTYAAICGLAAVSSAHVYLSSPKPFPGTISSPLDVSGSNFPCQMASHTGDASTMALGSTQKLAFIGSAVHGGGSCQVSITYDTNPTKDSVWKVLHSIEGGCPAQGQAGNMGDDPSSPVPYTYNYQLPTDIPAGNATIAWTWLNRIGNREFYMNCAAVSLTGSGGSKSNWESLPDMVVANIPSINSCNNDDSEGSDYLYPNPGNSVEKHPFNPNKLVPLSGDCGPTAAGGSGSGGSGGSGSSPTSAPVADSPISTPRIPSSTGLPGGVFITAPNGASSTPASEVPVASTPVVSPAAVKTPSSSPEAQAAAPTGGASSSPSSGSGSSGSSGSSPGSSSSSPGAQAAGSACSPEGLWNCVDGKSYQQCGSGIWSPVMQLAAGTTCTGGTGTNLNIFAVNGKTRRVAMRFRG